MRTIFNIMIIGMGLVGVSCHRQASSAVAACCMKERAAATSFRAAATSSRAAAMSSGTASTSSIADPLAAGASIYQLQGVWNDQHDHALPLAALKGKVRVVAMIFTHCGYACPRLVQEMKDIEDSLSPAEKKEVGFLLVSFDTRRDDPAQLYRYAGQQGLDDHWELLHGNAGQVRELSMALNVRYQETGDGNFSHSNAVFILDKEGAVRQTLEGLGTNTALAVETIDRLENQ